MDIETEEDNKYLTPSLFKDMWCSDTEVIEGTENTKFITVTESQNFLLG